MDIIGWVDTIDKKLLIALNGYHSPFWDQIMVTVTGRLFWVPFYVLIVAFIFFQERKIWWLAVIHIILMVVVADLFASSLLKPLTERLRPCHNDHIDQLLHMPAGCGGKYGFISSHSSNTFALATFLWLLFRKSHKWIILIFVWAAVVSYSRIYLGVHYPGDILSGMIAGIVWAILFFQLYQVVLSKLTRKDLKQI